MDDIHSRYQRRLEELHVLETSYKNHQPNTSASRERLLEGLPKVGILQEIRNDIHRCNVNKSTCYCCCVVVVVVGGCGVLWLLRWERWECVPAVKGRIQSMKLPKPSATRPSMHPASAPSPVANWRYIAFLRGNPLCRRIAKSPIS